MGAGKWRKEYADMLTGATVYIIADIDDTGKNHAQNVAKSLVGVADEINLIDLAAAQGNNTDLPQGYDISDFLESAPQEERKTAVLNLIANAETYGADNEESDFEGAELLPTGKISAAQQLMNLVEDSGTTFFHSEVKEFYACIPIENHTEIQPIDSRDFELWLNGLFYRETGKPISKDAVKQVTTALSAMALYDSPKPVKLSVRMAEYDGAFWYDLTNAEWQAVRIDKESWEIVDKPPIMFNRYRHQREQAMPKNGGNINKILDYVNIKENKTLFLCWLTSCFVPSIPHAANIIHGEKGAAKSTASAMLKLLIDPSALETLTLQSNQRTLAVNLQSHWLLPFDNVSFISEEVSDTLCRAITGGGIQQRKLHTNSEDVIFTFQRCVIINGINNVATRADLLDRSILTELVRIADSDRRELSDIMANFETDKAEILGGIFDTLVKAIGIYPAVRLQNLPRMADFARWGYAIGEALGEGLGQVFLDEYQQNYERQNDEVLNNDPVATLTLEFMKDKTDWHGTHSALHDKFVEIAENCAINAKDKGFPKDAAALGKRLRGIVSNLRHEGIFYTPLKRQSYGVPLTLERRNEPTLPTLSYTQARQAAENQGFASVGKNVGSGVGTKDEARPIPKPTLQPTPPQTAENKALSGLSVGNVGSVGEKTPFGEWTTVTDEELPPEFLKPTPPPAPQQEQLKI
jgi:hypothetical protein